jgi:RNA polymerase sigma-70 factor (ECF subfamily)
MSQEPGGGVFATTHWSVVLAAGDSPSPTASAALERLCEGYWFPLYAHFRRRGRNPEDAAELTQELFANLLRRDGLRAVGPEKGRFRTFLLTVADRLLRDRRSAETAQKRGGGTRPLELDALSAEERYSLEPLTEESPDRVFDRQWAVVLLDRALHRLGEEQAARDEAPVFARLKAFLAADAEPGEYGRLADELGLASNTIAKRVERLRERYRELVLAEALQTVGTPAEAAAELRSLFG